MVPSYCDWLVPVGNGKREESWEGKGEMHGLNVHYFVGHKEQ